MHSLHVQMNRLLMACLCVLLELGCTAASAVPPSGRIPPRSITAPGGHVVESGVLPEGLVVFRNSGKAKSPSARLHVSLIDRASGKPLWSDTLPGWLGVSPGRPAWAVLDNTVVVVLKQGDFQSAVVGLQKHTGRMLWTVDGVHGWMFKDTHTLLFRPYVIGNPASAPGSVLLQVVDLVSGAVSKRAWTLAARPSCGALQDGDLDAGFEEYATKRAFVVVRNDGCGVFTARFDWRAPGQPPPVVSDGWAHGP